MKVNLTSWDIRSNTILAGALTLFNCLKLQFWPGLAFQVSSRVFVVYLSNVLQAHYVRKNGWKVLYTFIYTHSSIPP